jgi:hypothetical protein
MVAFAAALAFVIYVTLDIERPSEGFVQVDRTLLEALVAELRAAQIQG